MEVGPTRTKGLTEEQKENIKMSINKLKAIIEIDNEEERKEKQTYHENINKQIHDISTEVIEERFNYTNPKQVKILLNVARIELFEQAGTNIKEYDTKEASE